MISILMTICMIADHDQCRDRRIDLAMEGLTPYRCIQKAQQKMADPNDPVLRSGEFVSKFTCKPSNVIATRI